MHRGNSSGGGQSSLGYLFGSGEAASASKTQNAPVQSQPANGEHSQNARIEPQPINKEIPAGIHGNLTNNYHRADGQNCGNFITVKPLLTSLLSSFELYCMNIFPNVCMS